MSPSCLGGTLVSPAGYQNNAGAVNNTNPFTRNIPRYQQVFGASDLTNMIGQHVTSIAFRVDENPQFGGNYAGGFTYSTIQIRLSITPLAVDALTTNLNTNPGPNPITVFNGPYVVPPLIGNQPVNPFDLRFSIQAPYMYTGGNLLVDILTPNVTTPLPLMDAVNVIDGVNRAYVDQVGSPRAGGDTLGLVTQFQFVPEPATSVLAMACLAAIVRCRGARRSRCWLSSVRRGAVAS